MPHLIRTMICFGVCFACALGPAYSAEASALALAPAPAPAPAPANARFDADALVGKVEMLLDRHYVVRDRLAAVVSLLESRRRDGAYRAAASRAEFVRLLNADLRTASHDRHLYVREKDDASQPSDASWEQREMAQDREDNHGIRAAEIMDGNIGYLRITRFAEPQRGLPALTAAMRLLRHTRAMVIDLRGNHGGYGGLPEYLASYWFEGEPVLLTSAHMRMPTEHIAQTFSLPAVDGDRRAGSPVFLLVDEGTGSAAEWLAYTLQSFGKGQVVGAQSSGGANFNEFFELDDRLRLSISIGQPMSEASHANWEGVGITPDVRCAPAEALRTALALAAKSGRTVP